MDEDGMNQSCFLKFQTNPHALGEKIQVNQLNIYLIPIFIFFPPKPHSPENVTTAILSYAVWHLHEGTGKIRKTCGRYSRLFNRVCPQCTVPEKTSSRSAFRCAGRGPAVTHSSTDSAPGCLTWVIAWYLLHTKRCRLHAKVFFKIFVSIFCPTVFDFFYSQKTKNSIFIILNPN